MRNDRAKNEVWLQQQLDYCYQKIKSNLDVFSDLVPSAASENQIFPAEKNIDWTASFWVGQLFLAKEGTKTTDFDEVIALQIESFQKRLDQQIELETHDIGFLYILSAVADYKVNDNLKSREMAIKAADLLMTRYNDKAHIIQAWGDLNNPEQSGRMIIDCLLNLPLLYFASIETGDPKYHEAAYLHAKQTQKYIVRANATTFHTYFFDVETGAAKFGKTQQGFSDDSCWARGQAWGIYGFTLSYLYTDDVSFIDTAIRLADYFIEKLPADKVPYWDLIFSDGSGEERDSSSGAIAVCGLLELAKVLPLSNPKRSHYEAIALEIIESLAINYTTKPVPESNGLLLHGVYDKNSNKGVDECMSWGDYYYLEALIRLNQVWRSYF
ncbi:glucuronyl hydrolase [Enterococcus sp. MMGLQ5-2]|nr:glycoside hydrolase family 88 protein [Enterococcus sp. MMGLQ5-2]MBS7584132.1 glycoside hydrolase family 88 protein [Enterococcus sp. MMGLQ5-1]NPD11990.1 glucuronyl hydrolase [Enterococcus sp. MMGLQ5-1]NPD37507.1 glucuronyl hydrolase [Enterococcus sp. MMGLQ5-2]